jgi:hypothetical protein
MRAVVFGALAPLAFVLFPFLAAAFACLSIVLALAAGGREGA